MVNQGNPKHNAPIVYQIMLDQLNSDITRASLPELILNFLKYQKLPKILLKKCITQTKHGTRLGPPLLPLVAQKIEYALTGIFERLSQLGDYGSLLKRKFSMEVDHFCPSLKKSNFITDYSPTAIDKELIKIVEFHQKQSMGRYKLANQFENNIHLAELEQKIKIFYELKRRREKTAGQVQKMDRATNYLLGPFFRHNYGYVDRRCLRCTSHFVQGSSTNACHPALSFYPIDSYDLASYDSFNSIENNVKASMCSMLNQPSGGVILLGCEREGTTFLAKGLLITEKEKDSLQQKLEGYLNKISPRIKRNQQIFIDFVPVVEGKENSNSSSKEIIVYEPVYGTFVCRIFMLPKQKYKVYLLKASNQHSTLEARKNNQSITIPDAEHYNFIIQKFEKHYDSAECLDGTGIPNCHYGIICSQPKPGKLAYDKKQEEQEHLWKEQQQHEKETEMQSGSGKKTEQKVAKPVDLENKKPQDYKLWTLVVGDKTTIQKLLECANDKENKGIKIEQLYAECKFKLTKTTWVMYHDDKFEAMKKLAEKHNITYKAKEIKMIASNVYLEVENEIYQHHYYNLYSILTSEYGCTVKEVVAKEVEGKKVWIVWFDSLKGSIYAYFYLSDQNYKVRFIRGASHFKNSPANSAQTLNSGTVSSSQPQPAYGYGYYNQGGYQGMYQGYPQEQQGYPQGYQGGYYPYG